jgi:hypothetical protein
MNNRLSWCNASLFYIKHVAKIDRIMLQNWSFAEQLLLNKIATVQELCLQLNKFDATKLSIDKSWLNKPLLL